MNLAGAGLALAFACFAAPPAAADTAAPATSPSAFTPKGADTCLKCHDEDSKVPVVAIFRTAHGQHADARTPFAQLQCESCHGPGGDHARKKPAGEPQGPIGTFGMNARTAPADQNKICLGCHTGAARMHWGGSAHDSAGLPCTACHVVHSEKDPVRGVATQAEVCGTCHARERAATFGASAHPLRQGRMSCTDCHAVHGSMGDKLLVQASVNDTCFTCHADKRGPFLWEHEPASEDCTLCHAPHGSPNRGMLTQRPPLLCQQCHSQAGHPSLALTPDSLPSGSPSAFLLVNGCVNCHSQVHGSNHPSGAGLAR